jgi:hypothetical protein
MNAAPAVGAIADAMSTAPKMVDVQIGFVIKFLSFWTNVGHVTGAQRWHEPSRIPQIGHFRNLFRLLLA